MESSSITPFVNNEKQLTRERTASKIEFPYSDLESAIDVVKGIHCAGGWSCESDQLAAKLEMEVSGGAFRLRINSARIFGLITYGSGRISLTELGKQATDPQTESSAKVNAFLAVELFKKVYEEYRGRTLPPPPALESALVGFGVGDKVKDRARQILNRSAKQAGFFASASDRLVKPKIDDFNDTPKENEQIEDIQDKPKKNGGGGGDDNNLHPAFQLLLKTLPEPGSEWDAKGRLNWLIMANSAFNMIYLSSANESEIEIKLK